MSSCVSVKHRSTDPAAPLITAATRQLSERDTVTSSARNVLDHVYNDD